MANELWEGISILSPQEMESSREESPNIESTEEEFEETVVEDSPSIVDPESTDSEKDFDNTEDSEGQETSEDTSEQVTQLNKYGALIKDLVNEGILTAAEEKEIEELTKDASADTIKELMKETVELAFQNKEKKWKNSFTGAKKRFLEIEDSFENTDQAIQMAQRLDYFETLDEDQLTDNVDLQKRLYYEYLTSSKKFSDEEAREAVEEADAVNKLESKSKKALPVLKKEAEGVVAEANKLKQKRQEEILKEHEDKFNSLIQAIDTKEEFIPGLKINKIVREKIKQNISTPVHKDEQGREYTSLMYKQKKNPTEFQMLMSYYDSLGLFNLDSKGSFKPDISKIKKVAKSDAVSELDRVLDRESEQGTGRFNSNNSSDKSKGILNLLDRAYGEKRKK